VGQGTVGLTKIVEHSPIGPQGVMTMRTMGEIGREDTVVWVHPKAAHPGFPDGLNSVQSIFCAQAGGMRRCERDRFERQRDGFEKNCGTQ